MRPSLNSHVAATRVERSLGVAGRLPKPWDCWGRVAIVRAMGQTVTCNTTGSNRSDGAHRRKGHHVENDVLRQAPLFSALDDEAAAALRSSMSENRLRRGEVLFHEGDPGDKLYIVTDGKVKLGRTSSDGRENLLAILGPGQMFGELSLFDPGPRSATVTAVTETTFLSLSHDDLLLWLEGRPGVSLGLLTQLAGRLRKTNEVVADLVFSDVPGRVAKALLDLADRFGRTADDGVHVHHDLTQEELAQLVGASRETVNKALADFASRGWLRLEPRSVVIIDVERLARRAR
jgi:CRP/FNR family cyclic AMP-dependent transcriptional regulator